MPVYTKCSRCGKRVPQGSVCECSKQRYKEYNKKVRQSKDNIQYTRFYNSPEWKRLSQYIKIKYKHLCVMCLIKNHEINLSDAVHHIEEIRECWEERLDEKNCIPLCHRCHNSIHIDYTNNIKKELRELLNQYAKNYM